MVRLTTSTSLELACAIMAIGIAQQASQAQVCQTFEQHRLVATDPQLAYTWPGRVMAGSGDWIVLGLKDYVHDGVETGAAVMLHKANGQWAFAQTLLAPDGAANDEFGFSVDIDGPWAVVGANGVDHPGATNDGAAFVFFLDGKGPQWVHHSTLIGMGVPPFPGVGLRMGAAVAVSGDTIMVGAPWESSAGTIKGAVFVFEFDGAQWAQTQMFIAPDAAAQTNSFGRGIALDGDAAFIANASTWLGPPSAPHVYAFRRTTNSWSFEQFITPAAVAMAIDGDRAVMGNSQITSPAAYALQYDGRAWNIVQQLIPTVAMPGEYGKAVAVAGDHIVVGSNGADVWYEYPTYSWPHQGVGNAFAFRFDGTTWQEHLRLLPAFYGYDAYLPLPNNLDLGWGVVVLDDEAVVAAPNHPHGMGHFFSFDLEPRDCDNNDSPDHCDPDCNFNLANDACEIAAGTTDDCNANTTPDECEQAAAYLLDDGTGWWVIGPWQTGGDYIWLNQYNVLPGGEHITHISLVWTAYTFDGTPGTIMLYDDPNDDGDPNDAVLLASAPITGHGVFGLNASAFTIEPIDRTFVGNVGESFFVGVHMPNPLDNAHAVSDNSPAQQRSWRAMAPLGQGNIVNLAANPTPPEVQPRNWMLRAHAHDCNGNGTWDQCDIDSGFSLDLNGNGIPDECDAPCPADINSSGGVDVSDLLSVINAWGACPAPCPADITGNGSVDVSDLLAVINAWGVCP